MDFNNCFSNSNEMDPDLISYNAVINALYKKVCQKLLLIFFIASCPLDYFLMWLLIQLK